MKSFPSHSTQSRQDADKDTLQIRSQHRVPITINRLASVLIKTWAVFISLKG
jgi:hypothetical protein